jgi:hypothetical protein
MRIQTLSSRRLVSLFSPSTLLATMTEESAGPSDLLVAAKAVADDYPPFHDDGHGMAPRARHLAELQRAVRLATSPRPLPEKR